MFLCKCELFVRRFGLEQYQSVFVKEERVKIKTGGADGKGELEKKEKV